MSLKYLLIFPRSMESILMKKESYIFFPRINAHIKLLSSQQKTKHFRRLQQSYGRGCWLPITHSLMTMGNSVINLLLPSIQSYVPISAVFCSLQTQLSNTFQVFRLIQTSFRCCRKICRYDSCATSNLPQLSAA